MLLSLLHHHTESAAYASNSKPNKVIASESRSGHAQGRLS